MCVYDNSILYGDLLHFGFNLFPVARFYLSTMAKRPTASSGDQLSFIRGSPESSVNV